MFGRVGADSHQLWLPRARRLKVTWGVITIVLAAAQTRSRCDRNGEGNETHRSDEAARDDDQQYFGHL